jgi:hypothetical protein
MMIIGTLMALWIPGIIAGAVMFTRDANGVGDVKELKSISDALAMIGRNKRAQGSLVVLAMFMGAFAFMAVYLGVVVVYYGIVNRKGLFLTMKRKEVENDTDRKQVKKRRAARGWALIAENTGDTR